MVRAIAMSAASALCLIWAAGCADTSDSASKAASPSVAAKTADGTPVAGGQTPAVAENMPITLDGEIQRADQLRIKGDYDEAVRSFAQLMLVAPDDARVVGGYGKVLEQQGHSKDAQAFLQRAVAINPRDWSLQSALGVADDQLDDHKGARTAYQRALALKPGEGSVLNNYAVSLMLAGDYPAAKRMLAEAEARGISNPKIALNLDKLSSLDDVAVASAAPAPQPASSAKSAPAGAATIQTKPVAVANLGASAVQTASAKPASKVTVAVTKPMPQSAPPATNTTRVATTAPKPLTSNVVMEAVPKDPLAGRVKHKEHPEQKLASTAHAPAKPASPKAPVSVAPPPALRTAAGSD
jgi:Flp pilus assembly protein TadD